MSELTVTIVGPVGSGKSAIAGEIEIALKAIGVPVRYADVAGAQMEKNTTHADWQTYIEMYHPSVVLVEAVDDPMARHLMLGYHQICKGHTGRMRGHWHQTMIRHARYGINFQ